MKNWCCYLYVFILTCSPFVECFLNLEELKNVNYGIDIVNIPVSLEFNEHVEANTMMVSSKFGQKYMCSFPDSEKQEKEKEEEEKLAKEIGIPELLKPLETGACLIKTKDWWSYEFCYGRYIRQYHVEEGKIVSEIIYLGHYESEFDWSADGEQKAKKTENKNMLNRYHSQQYVNGSECDLTEKRRQTEVRFMCEEGSGDYIARIDEPETCKYILTVHTMRICHHPYLKPPKQTKPITITCNPLLTKEQYQEYMIDKEEEEKSFQEDTENIKNNQESTENTESVDQSPKAETEIDSEDPSQLLDESEDLKFHGMDTEDMTVDDFDNVEDLLSKSLTNGMKSFVQKVAGQPLDDTTNLKVLKNTKDLKHFLYEKDLDEDEEEVTKEEGPPGEDEINGESDTLKFKQHRKNSDSKDELADVDEDIDPAVTDDLDKEMDRLKSTYSKSKERFSKMKTKLKKAMQSQFDDIVKEASDELAKDGVNVDNVDKDEAFKELASTLNTLLKKLEKTEKEIADVDSEIEKVSGDAEKKKDGKDHPSTQEKDKESEVEHKAESNVKIRVTRIKSGDTLKEGKEVENVHTKQLENVVKKGLEKAGLDAGGNKVQVRIITAGYYDSDDDSIHILSDKDTSNFQNMIVAILGGDNEASSEQRKHQQMENTYSYVFGKSNKRKTVIKTDNAGMNL